MLKYLGNALSSNIVTQQSDKDKTQASTQITETRREINGNETSRDGERDLVRNTKEKVGRERERERNERSQRGRGGLWSEFLCAPVVFVSSFVFVSKTTTMTTRQPT